MRYTVCPVRARPRADPRGTPTTGVLQGQEGLAPFGQQAKPRRAAVLKVGWHKFKSTSQLHRLVRNLHSGFCVLWAVRASLCPAPSHIQIRRLSLCTIRIYARLDVAAAAKTLCLNSLLKGPPVHLTVPYGVSPLFFCAAACGSPLCTCVLCFWVEFPCVWAVGLASFGALFPGICT